ncbi:histidine phosphatase family protein [Paractinoplanes atraurantiacus]|uniref:Broad specificity phosphatase PhoE n=1 Tax=Paractinoplanes atraurantiacus TaxID=1036182 RepID=A0A285JNP7_9ACTN|nr:histidine phosphatase family protein [Actinoplanes atraurantiacus]SNY61427.1 Broad specificity phosphatase PhoE [Actinoplanes atraurantiacus]
MARLLLVRHGQASFGADDYDALSGLGGEQARVLGKSLADRGIRPSLVLRGSLRRHEQTVAGLLEGLGDDVPVSVDDGWDEFDFQRVVELHEPDYRERMGSARAFQELFEAATGRWCSGEYDGEYAESFPAFRSRVGGALERTGELLKERREVVVVSSGGPIALVASLLTAGAEAGPVTMATMWTALNRVVVNTGVTKLVSGRSGLWLSTYNEHTHLEADPRLLTYR